MMCQMAWESEFPCLSAAVRIIVKIALINYFKGGHLLMKKYVFLGDSLIYGYGVKPKDNWVYKLQTKYNLSLYNKGVNGSTTTDMLVRFQKDVLDLNPTDLFIMGGTNDLLSNRSVQSIANNI